MYIGEMSTFPGPVSAPLIEEFSRYGVVEPRKYVIDLAACSGMKIVTIDGQEIIDWAGFYGSKLLGHNHPIYADESFQRKLLTVATNKVANPDFVTPELIEYYRFLHQNAPKGMTNPNMRVYTLNSGAEAIENALKFCVAKWHAKSPRATTRPKFMSFYGGFHGRTVYALHVTDMPHNPSATRDYHELLDEPVRVPFPVQDMNSISIAIDMIKQELRRNAGNLAGIIVEPMQGAGGHNVTSPIFFQALSQLAHDHDVPLIIDEVQTGGGQCDAMWMSDTFDMPHPPTCVASAKKLGCGVLYMIDQMPDAGVLDSTWSGHLVDMVRVVHEYQHVHREGLITVARARAKTLRGALLELQARHSVVSNIRGCGLYQGFSVGSQDIKSELITRALEQESLLLLGAGTETIRFRPNICVTVADIEDLTQRLDRLLSSF